MNYEEEEEEEFDGFKFKPKNEYKSKMHISKYQQPMIQNCDAFSRLKTSVI